MRGEEKFSHLMISVLQITVGYNNNVIMNPFNLFVISDFGRKFIINF